MPPGGAGRRRGGLTRGAGAAEPQLHLTDSDGLRITGDLKSNEGFGSARYLLLHKVDDDKYAVGCARRAHPLGLAAERRAPQVTPVAGVWDFRRAPPADIKALTLEEYEEREKQGVRLQVRGETAARLVRTDVRPETRSTRESGSGVQRLAIEIEGTLDSERAAAEATGDGKKRKGKHKVKAHATLQATEQSFEGRQFDEGRGEQDFEQDGDNLWADGDRNLVGAPPSVLPAGRLGSCRAAAGRLGR